VTTLERAPVDALQVTFAVWNFSSGRAGPFHGNRRLGLARPTRWPSAVVTQCSRHLPVGTRELILWEPLNQKERSSVSFSGDVPDWFADSGPSRTVIPAHCGQRSGDLRTVSDERLDSTPFDIRISRSAVPVNNRGDRWRG
jgi:hypothetical protein